MNDAGTLLVISIILEMFGASRLFVAIDRCFTVIYRLPERTFLRRNLVAFGMVSIFIALFILMLAASSTPSILIDEISSKGFRFGVYMIGILSSLLVSFVLFEIIYWIVPNKKMSFKVTWCGALVAACLLEIVIILFPLYVENNTKSYTGK
jgi:membrane protein